MNNGDLRKLAAPLADLLDINNDTLPNVLFKIWQYIKANRLQDQEDKRFIKCDEKLEAVLIL